MQLIKPRGLNLACCLSSAYSDRKALVRHRATLMVLLAVLVVHCMIAEELGQLAQKKLRKQVIRTFSGQCPSSFVDSPKQALQTFLNSQLRIFSERARRPTVRTSVA